MMKYKKRQKLDDMYSNYMRWCDYAGLAISLKREGKPLEELVASGDGKRKMDQIRRQSAEFIAEEQRIKTERRQAFAVAGGGANSGGYFALSLIFSALIAYWGRKQLLALGVTYATALTHEQGNKPPCCACKRGCARARAA